MELVVPEHTNHYGTLYGATALQLMGKAAFICGSRYARCPIVMARADDIEFRKPVRLGEIVDLRAEVVRRGRSSMTVTVDLTVENASGEPDRPRITGRFLMVAVDDQGSPIPIPGQAGEFPEEISF